MGPQWPISRINAVIPYILNTPSEENHSGGWGEGWSAVEEGRGRERGLTYSRPNTSKTR